MYAITHASTALILKRRFRVREIWPLLVSVQAIELLWAVFVYVGIEYVRYSPDRVHLDFLPYSHSVATTAAVALIGWVFYRYGRRRPALAVAVAAGVMSHVVLDLVHHEPDIALLPMAAGPRFGFNLQGWPLADLIVEILFGAMCWFVAGGSRALLIAIVALNLANIPFMFPRPGTGAVLARRPAVLPTVILVQIVLTWLAIWYFARERDHVHSLAGPPA
jgi:hypothetical protein